MDFYDTIDARIIGLSLINFASRSGKMARISPDQMKINFKMEFSEQLDPDNELVRLAELINWDLADKLYYPTVSPSVKNTNSKESRMAFGALILQQRYKFTDRMLIQMVSMNPYFQYFLGLDGFQHECPFTQSTLVLFRKRITFEMIMQINEEVCRPMDNNDDDDVSPTNRQKGRKKTTSQGQTKNKDTKNKGKLILDATCAPQDIKFPTDLELLNKAREKTEAIIDAMHEPMIGHTPKPRTYRNNARKSYLNVAKSKKRTRAKIRRAIRYQLGCLRRNIRYIKEMSQTQGYQRLTPKQTWDLIVINELLRQQQHMYDHKIHSIENRIVSLHAPHIRPIVRGKAKSSVEFGAKVAISVVNGYTSIEKLSWDSFNEGLTLIESVTRYKERYGFYPKQVLADKIYRNLDNIKQMNEWGIKLLGPKLGRPKKGETINKRLERKLEGERNIVESKFGQAKRRYGLNLIMTRLKDSSETVIGLTFLVMNLERRLSLSFTQFLKWLKLTNISFRKSANIVRIAA